MISRLTIAAALFAIVATSALAMTGNTEQPSSPQAVAMKTVQLERVVIVGKRIAP